MRYPLPTGIIKFVHDGGKVAGKKDYLRVEAIECLNGIFRIRALLKVLLQVQVFFSPDLYLAGLRFPFPAHVGSSTP